MTVISGPLFCGNVNHFHLHDIAVKMNCGRFFSKNDSVRLEVDYINRISRSVCSVTFEKRDVTWLEIKTISDVANEAF